jgi:lipopolysaccharide transport system permease protein
MSSLNTRTIVIKPEQGWQPIDFKELKEYRDLLYFLVWRDIKVLYAQTILGFGWAILQPLTQIVVFTVIFGKVAKVPSEGVPYFLYSTVAIIPWTYMSNAIIQSSQSLVSGQNMLGKIYFPRLLFPLTPALSRLVDFGISLFILLAIMLFYGVHISWNLLYFPLFVVLMMCVSVSIGMWLSALAIRYRDIKFAMQFVMQLLIYSAPILYSAAPIPDPYRILYSINPIVSVIEGFRACLLGSPMPWMYIIPGMITAFILLYSSAMYFRRMERVFADVI